MAYYFHSVSVGKFNGSETISNALDYRYYTGSFTEIC